MTTPIITFVVGWIFCGVLTYGFLAAHFQRKFTLIAAEYRVQDRVFSMGAALTGPIGLLTTICLGYFRKGWML